MDKQLDRIIDLGIGCYIILHLLVIAGFFGAIVTGIYLLLKNFG